MPAALATRRGTPLIIPMLYPCLSTREHGQDQETMGPSRPPLSCSQARPGTDERRPARQVVIQRFGGSLPFIQSSSTSPSTSARATRRGIRRPQLIPLVCMLRHATASVAPLPDTETPRLVTAHASVPTAHDSRLPAPLDYFAVMTPAQSFWLFTMQGVVGAGRRRNCGRGVRVQGAATAAGRAARRPLLPGGLRRRTPG
jgi:hypothetical protein